jgi:hypothetical protein
VSSNKTADGAKTHRTHYDPESGGIRTIRAGVPILHADPDFDVLARHTALRTVPV